MQSRKLNTTKSTFQTNAPGFTTAMTAQQSLNQLIELSRQLLSCLVKIGADNQPPEELEQLIEEVQQLEKERDTQIKAFFSEQAQSQWQGHTALLSELASLDTQLVEAGEDKKLILSQALRRQRSNKKATAAYHANR